VKFVVPIRPMPSPRPRATRQGRIYMPADYEKWKREFAKCIPYQLQTQSNALCMVSVTACYAVPKSYSKTEREAALGSFKAPAGDCDNLAKSCLDAMNEITWVDDRQVVELHVKKRYALEDCVEVAVEWLDDKRG